MKQAKKPKTRWHHLLGKLLEELLIPVGIEVLTDVAVMSEPPEADILLLRNKSSRWTEEQKARLPDGIRASRATDMLLEGKYTGSVNENVFRQTLCYDYLYRCTKQKKQHEVQTFLISSKTTRQATLEQFGYSTSDSRGVYHSVNPLLKWIPLISLNELSDELHNASIKCFASREKEKKTAFESLMRKGLQTFSVKFQYVLEGLLHYYFRMRGEIMELNLTPEEITEWGKEWGDALLAGLPLDDMLSRYGKKEWLSRFTMDELLSQFSAKEIESYLEKLKQKQQK